MSYVTIEPINQIKTKRNKVVLKEMMKVVRRRAGIFLESFQKEDDSYLGNDESKQKEIKEELYTNLRQSFSRLKSIDFFDNWTNRQKYRAEEIMPFFDEENISKDNWRTVSDELFNALIDIEILTFLSLNDVPFDNKESLYKQWLSFNNDLLEVLSDNVEYWIKLERSVAKTEKANKQYSKSKKLILKNIARFGKIYRDNKDDLSEKKVEAFKIINTLSIISYYIGCFGEEVDLEDKIS